MEETGFGPFRFFDRWDGRGLVSAHFFFLIDGMEKGSFRRIFFFFREGIPRDVVLILFPLGYMIIILEGVVPTTVFELLVM